MVVVNPIIFQPSILGECTWPLTENELGSNPRAGATRPEAEHPEVISNTKQKCSNGIKTEIGIFSLSSVLPVQVVWFSVSGSTGPLKVLAQVRFLEPEQVNH